jgi:hypothetical protein
VDQPHTAARTAASFVRAQSVVEAIDRCRSAC